MHLDLGRQTQRSVACFSLHSHMLRVETRGWEHHDGTCDLCGLQAIQDEKNALFLCRCTQMCSLRLQFADLFHDLPMAHKITDNQAGAFYSSQACSQDAFNFFQRQTNDSYRFISELMDVFCMASQIWGTRYMKQGAEMDCPLQTVRMCLLKGILGVKRTAPNWSVLRVAKTPCNSIGSEQL